MKLFNEINSFFKRVKLEHHIFKLLSIYDQTVENHECLRLIGDIIQKIKNSMCEYQKTKNQELYNTIDNDFITLQDLHEEYKREVYPLFPVKGIALLMTMNESNLDLMCDYVRKYMNNDDFETIKSNFVFQIYQTLSYFPDVAYQDKIKDFLSNNRLTDAHLESIMISLKQHKRELKDEGLESAYIELLAMYFHFLYKEFK